MHRLLGFALLFASLGIVLALVQSDADGCAPVRRSDRPEDYVRIAEESAIIIWDPVKKIEHFIRRAAFDTKSPDFGFLVPTPPGPELPRLKEVEDAIFGEAAKWIQPRLVVQSRLNYDPLVCMLGCPMMVGSSSKKDAKGGVQVLAEQKVGGYETAILAADNTEALATWLKDNGYSNDPELQSWLVPYVTEKWKITAFKISQDPKTGQLATTKPVRMSFATERPFFPYREPEVKDDKASTGRRLLRVFFVSDTRVDGKLGAAAWHAKVPWSDELSGEQRSLLAKETGVPEAELPAKAWMTAFEDPASPRPGTDEVYFEPARERTAIRPPDIIRYEDTWVPIDLVGIGLVVLVVAIAVFAKLARGRKA